MSGWTDHALETLRAAGFRSGAARRAVVELLGRQHCALTARDIDRALRAEGRTVGRASVYRALEQLADLRLLQRLEMGQDFARYEAVRPGGDHHHHLVCDTCGRVEPFADPALERAIEHVAGRVSFAVADHDVVLHGACRACRGGATGSSAG